MKIITVIISVMFCMICCSWAVAQTQSQLPGGIDVNKLMKMSPAELEQYKQQMLKQASMQAKAIAKQGNLKIDEMKLPDFEVKMPSRDAVRLATIPPQPPTQLQLMDGVRNSIQQVKAAIPSSNVAEITKIAETQSPDRLQGSAIALWYSDKGPEALYVAMQSILKNPGEPVAWNNLAALYNMGGFEHKAIPILMRQLVEDPENPMLLNNMGQAYLGLGAIAEAESFLKDCLAIDALHPEANRAMAMIAVYKKDAEAAQRYFEKELEVAHRRSTLAQMKRAGYKFDLYKLRQKRTGVPQKNFFEEINLQKFTPPELPLRSDDTRRLMEKNKGYLQSIGNENMYWLSVAAQTNDPSEGKRYPGVYHDLVKALLDDLHKTYTPKLLSPYTDEDMEHMKQMIETFGKTLAERECESAPPLSSRDVILAYERKCCDRRKPVIDAFMNEMNSLASKRAFAAMSKWKTYLNALINIASLDPSPGNQRMVYGTVSAFFTMLSNAMHPVQYIDMPQECENTLTTAQADSVIESSRKIDLNCPPWLNIEYDVFIGKIKADCSKYAIEGGKVLQASYEKNFKTGTSTISAGVGIKAKFFASVGSAGLKQMVYISFDNNNEFSDFGLKGNAGVGIGDTPIQVADGIGKIGGTIAGIDGGYTLGINSGFKTEVKGTGLLSDIIKIDKPLP